jgi:hypothetical protein
MTRVMELVPASEIEPQQYDPGCHLLHRLRFALQLVESDRCSGACLCADEDTECDCRCFGQMHGYLHRLADGWIADMLDSKQR